MINDIKTKSLAELLGIKTNEAKHIKKCVNYHNELVELAKEFHAYVQLILESSGEDNGEYKLMQRIDKLIKKAGAL